MLETEIRKGEPQHALVMVAGELDTSNVAELYEELADLTREGVRHIAMNLAELEFVDSTGLSALIAVHKRAESMGENFILFFSQSGYSAAVRGDRDRHVPQHPATERTDDTTNLKTFLAR